MPRLRSLLIALALLVRAVLVCAGPIHCLGSLLILPMWGPSLVRCDPCSSLTGVS